MRQRNLRKALVLATFVSCVGSACAIHHAKLRKPDQPQEGTFTVWVVTHGNYILQEQGHGDQASVGGARVFILAEDGRELASAMTNNDGIAVFSELPAESRPKYLLAERAGFFISGQRLYPGAKLYLLDMVVHYIVDEPSTHGGQRFM